MTQAQARVNVVRCAVMTLRNQRRYPLRRIYGSLVFTNSSRGIRGISRNDRLNLR